MVAREVLHTDAFPLGEKNEGLTIMSTDERLRAPTATKNIDVVRVTPMQ